MIPLRFPSGDPTPFDIIRPWLAQLPYTDEAICRRRGGDSIYDLAIGGGAHGTTSTVDALDVVLALFFDHIPIDEALVLVHLEARVLEALEALGLVQRANGRVQATVLLYPNDGLWLVSDLPPDESKPIEAHSDVVYPAFTSSVRTFLSTLPTGSGVRFLELCSGTGVAALQASRAGAARAVAVDITERSTIFAAFNAHLNGLPLEAVQGDLFAPLAGQRFDMIVAHPPYVPALSTKLIFRDGGADGEQISRAILSQAVSYLDVGGVLHCTCLITARHGAPVVDRVRGMFGAQAAEIDLLVVKNGVADRHSNFVRELLKASADEVPTVIEQLRHFQALGVEGAELVTIVARRHGEARPGTARGSERSAATAWPAVRWALDVQAFFARGDAVLEPFLKLRPRLSRYAQFTLTYRASGDADDPWAQTSGTLSTTYPLVSTMEANGGDAAFVGSLHGDRSFREILHQLKESGSVPTALGEEEFAATVAPLVQRGIVETDGFPFPS